ncbi:hypothetical protein SAMN05421767_1372 [Granulicatella balaenopterae]|uniref:Uncharacterized protein n=1 Tax=Granulicatella balaenopterae TaxID=137733 RepID=A0A1H9NA22_9LACT|nr:hypothetical protein [Granulicatella balaenopterae]SER32900.1 hypothetical protein SAMN05421767_1372 [Granulicatella balaenopterae]
MKKIDLNNYRVVIGFYNDKPDFLRLVQSTQSSLKCYLLESTDHQMIAAELSENNFVLVNEGKVIHLNHHDLITIIGKVNNHKSTPLSLEEAMTKEEKFYQTIKNEEKESE